MKHKLKTTLFIVILFLIIQIFGVFLTSTTMNFSTNNKGETKIDYNELNSGFERQQMNVLEGISYMLFGVFLGTIFLIFLLKKKKTMIWKGWMGLGIFFTMYITISELTNFYIGFIFALLLTLKKFYQNDFITNIITEILIYPSFAILFSDFITIPVAFIILGIISIYDYIAVFKSKHMVFMAKEITKNKVFMGLVIPENIDKKSLTNRTFFDLNNNEKNKDNEKNEFIKQSDNNSKNKIKVSEKESDNLGIAILGGGDVAFPLLFNVAILKFFGLIPSIISSIIVSIGLFVFFLFTKKNKFYPAIPPLTLSCLVAYIIIYILF